MSKKILVRAITGESCYGCVFEHDSESKCPRTERNVLLCFGDSITDLIWIHDTEKAMAQYVARQMGGCD